MCTYVVYNHTYACILHSRTVYWHISSEGQDVARARRKIFYQNPRSDRARWKFNSRRQPVISRPRGERERERAAWSRGIEFWKGLYIGGRPILMHVASIRRLESSIFMKIPKQRSSPPSSIHRILFNCPDITRLTFANCSRTPPSWRWRVARIGFVVSFSLFSNDFRIFVCVLRKEFFIPYIDHLTNIIYAWNSLLIYEKRRIEFDFYPAVGCMRDSLLVLISAIFESIVILFYSTFFLKYSAWD